jgi:hypothetical protein
MIEGIAILTPFRTHLTLLNYFSSRVLTTITDRVREVSLTLSLFHLALTVFKESSSSPQSGKIKTLMLKLYSSTHRK